MKRVISSSSWKRIKGVIVLTRPVVSFGTNTHVIIGFLLAKQFHIVSLDLFPLVGYFLCLSLLYGAIYIINDVCDIKNDRNHPLKSRIRPLASGAVSMRDAVFTAVCLIAASFSLSILISLRTLGFMLIFLLINLAYSLVIKNIPYLDIVLNTITHPLRTVFGLVMGGALLSSFTSLILTETFVQISLTVLRRIKEYDSTKLEARPSLKKYSLAHLKLIQGGFFFLAVLHLLLTYQDEGILWRLLILLFGIIVTFYNKPKSLLNRIINVWIGCESFSSLKSYLQSLFSLDIAMCMRRKYAEFSLYSSKFRKE